jgi:hypothetical protein
MLALFLVDVRYRYDAGINTFDTANVDCHERCSLLGQVFTLFLL